MQNDTRLIQNLQTKDERALSLLYDKYSGAIYSVILKMVKEEGKAQDLLQETFITVWDKSSQYDPEKGRFYTWIYRIAKNKVLNTLRKSDILIQSEDLSVYKEKEDETIGIDTKYLELNGAVSELDTHHRNAIELVYFKGLTHREAHQVMDIPLGTFKSYVRQAIMQLRKSYSKLMGLIVLILNAL